MDASANQTGNVQTIMNQSSLRKRIAAIVAIGTLLFAQAAAAMMACQGGFTLDRAGAELKNPCPMTQDAPAPLCRQKCDPDENKGQALDILSLAPREATLAPGSIETITSRPLRLAPPGLDRETGPPLYVVFLRLPIP